MSEWKPTQVVRCINDHFNPALAHYPQMVDVFTWGDYQYFLNDKDSEFSKLWRRAGDEVETRLILASGSIALKASNNKYVSADERDNYFLRAEWKDAPPDLWETFNIVDAGNGQVALKAFNGKYVSVDSTEGRIPQLRSDWVDTIENYEKFQIVFCGDSRIALKAHNGLFVGANLDNRGNLTAWVDKVQGWEMFRWEPINVANVLNLHRQLLSKHDEVIGKLDEISRLLDRKTLEELFQNAISKVK